MPKEYYRKEHFDRSVLTHVAYFKTFERSGFRFDVYTATDVRSWKNCVVNMYARKGKNVMDSTHFVLESLPDLDEESNVLVMANRKDKKSLERTILKLLRKS